ncbi:hypothetical protein KAR91_37190 [Candidatus Pacearchaeota archaeon]|nr:hypothetical protein [Candidatus Pacearchaeota archaeon]
MQEDLFGQKGAPGMSVEMRSILRIIQKCKGKAQAIRVAVITHETDIPDRKARDLVKHLVEDHHYPIGSCPAGFFMAETKEEIEEVYHTMVSWALSVLKRASAFKKNSRLDEVLGQLKLELKPS